MYENFDNGEPNNFLEEHCVEMVVASSLWYDTDCEQYTRPFVCEFGFNGDYPTSPPVTEVIPPYDAPRNGECAIHFT